MVKELLQKNSSNRAQPRRIRSPNRQPSGLTVCVLVALLALSMIPTIQAQEVMCDPSMYNTCEWCEYVSTRCGRCRDGFANTNTDPKCYPIAKFASESVVSS